MKELDIGLVLLGITLTYFGVFIGICIYYYIDKKRSEKK